MTHPKRKKRILMIIMLFSICILAITAYGYSQYTKGLNSSAKEIQVKEEPKINIQKTKETDEFNGTTIDNTLGKVNVLLLGIDARDEEQSRTDTIMIAQFDPKNESAKLISVMRDIYAEIPDYRNYKINTAYFLGGPELLRQTLKLNLDIDLHYYAIIDFKGFEKAVDALAPKGIEINVEKAMSEYIDVSLQPGIQNLNGKELLGYSRFRADAEADFGRVRRQQQVITALKDEITSINGLAMLPRIVRTVQPYIETNLKTMEVMGLIKDFILHPPNHIEALRVPVNGSFTNTTYRHAGAVLEIDKELNKQEIKRFLNE
ncbi:LCP family protein [Litchfieldia salsa]|uniref:Regulatory protein MsrR n=1 Tax=Litchfieldia salsa TaxID=930152 RepID=A0A1H0WVZ7_9BACI|nr:LCP family protein [Litchfieldia salsa]SDP94759.1 cell envelope-related function transcriptional attenuator common domain-containing protein [Litchfieldia salsa]